MMKVGLLTVIIVTGMVGLSLDGYAQPASGNTAQTLHGQHAISSQDQQFMNRAAQINLSEIRLNQLALDKSNDPKIKELATRMMQDHTQANADLAKIVKPIGFILPLTPDVQQQTIYTQLSSLPGASFDQAFVQQMIQAHQEAIDLFKTQSVQGKKPELKAYALTYLPGLETHLASLQQSTGQQPQIPGVQTIEKAPTSPPTQHPVMPKGTSGPNTNLNQSQLPNITKPYSGTTP